MKLMDIINPKDIWSLANFIIQLIIAAATLLLFLVALSQTKAAQNAAGSAIDAVKVAEKSYNLAKREADNTAIENQKKFDTQTKLAEAQIKALEDQVNTMKEQFEIENTPYLQIGHMLKVDLQPNRPLNIVYAINNFGRHPVQTTERLTMYMVSGINNPNIPYLLENLHKQKPKEGVFYINQSGIQVPDSFIENITQEVYDGIISGKLAIYFTTETTYVNLVNKKKRKFASTVKITSINPPNMMVFNTDNFDL